MRPVGQTQGRWRCSQRREGPWGYIVSGTMFGLSHNRAAGAIERYNSNHKSRLPSEEAPEEHKGHEGVPWSLERFNV